MTEREYLWLLIGMIAVTVVPRVLPQWAWREGAGGRRVQTALGLVPFAVLGRCSCRGSLPGWRIRRFRRHWRAARLQCGWRGAR